MNNFLHKISLAALLAISAISCSQDPADENTIIPAADVVLAATIEQIETKIDFSDNDGDAIDLQWEQDDAFTIYDAAGNRLCDFRCMSEEDAANGRFKFDSNSSISISNGTYTAIFPATSKATLDEAISEDATSNNQNGDECDNFNDVCSMTATFNYEGDKNTTLNFKHKLAVMTFKFKSEQRPRKLVFQNGTERSYIVTFKSLEPEDGVYTSNIMINPCEEMERTLIFSLYNNSSEAYDVRVDKTSIAYEAGKRYTTSVSDIEDTIVYGDGKENTLPEIVDLNNGWKLDWHEEFDYSTIQDFDKVWTRQEWSSPALIGGRFKENVEVRDGVLYLLGKKESRDGFEWTSGSVCTKKRDFKFGFFEARMKYAAATGLNNAFWLWNDMNKEYPYEIDINEGHYPNVINTNQHYRWYRNGDTSQRVNETSTQIDYVGTGVPVLPYAAHTYSTPLKATKIRFTTVDPYIFTMGEFRVFAPNEAGYPDKWVESKKDFDNSEYADIENLMISKKPKLTSCGCSSVNGKAYPVSYIVDGQFKTTWKPNDIEEKWFEAEFDEPIEIGHIQLLSGWKDSKTNKWCKRLSQYKIEYFDGEQWRVASEFDNTLGFKLSDGFHNYALYWDEERIIYYFDGEPIREIDFYGGQCFWNGENRPMISEQTIYLSLAVLDSCTGGVITDKIDGTSQQIDWVRVYKKEE